MYYEAIPNFPDSPDILCYNVTMSLNERKPQQQSPIQKIDLRHHLVCISQATFTFAPEMKFANCNKISTL